MTSSAAAEEEEEEGEGEDEDEEEPLPSLEAGLPRTAATRSWRLGLHAMSACLHDW